ncbi:growth-regulated protein homolog isoform X1 [Phyllostomus discolor]|uniref:C-X-C motif chemokine n=1 Tax=Phyllostomus discolor TaxID=89673 RepID=A0A7E6DG01_9CHIR|nr:growth-regulated protein homolog isoform X1 [Phyllostomus discolor]
MKCSSGNFPGPGAASFAPLMWIKRVRPPPGATDRAQPALPLALALQALLPRPTELSTMARTATAAVSCAPGLLRAALLLLLLVTSCQHAAGETWRPGIPRTVRGTTGRCPWGTAPLTESVVPKGVPVGHELRCQCVQTLQRIPFKLIQSVKVTPPGASCDHTEVIATLKNGQKACLNPEAPVVKNMIEKMLNKGSTN